MKLFKLIMSCLILGFIALFIWQNMAAFKTVIPFSLNIYIHEQMRWGHYLYTLLFCAAFVGFLAGFVVMLKPYFNARRLVAQQRQEKQQASSPQPASPTEQETAGTS